MKIYDISVDISSEMKVYSEDEKVEITDICRLDKGDSCNNSRVNMTMHTGTHADMPLHFIKDGMSCDKISLDHFFGKAKLFHLSVKDRAVSKSDLTKLNICKDDIILLNTNQNILQPEAADYLSEKEIKALGVDILSVDEFNSPDFPVHKILLGNDIPILEGLVLDNVPNGIYELHALPLKFKNGNGSPVRAVLFDKFKPELIIFDMDGLMIDTEPISKEGWNLGLKHYGFEMDEVFFSRLLGRNIATARELMTKQYGEKLDFNAVHMYRSNYVEEHIKKHGIKIKKGLHFLLDSLDKLGLKKCIATSTEYEGMEKKLKGLNLFPRFDVFVTGDRVKIGKPDPEIFLKAAEEMKIAPENCLVLEDSNAGANAAIAAGMRVIVVPDIAQPNEDIRKNVLAVCEDLYEAGKVIKSQLLI